MTRFVALTLALITAVANERTTEPRAAERGHAEEVVPRSRQPMVCTPASVAITPRAPVRSARSSGSPRRPRILARPVLGIAGARGGAVLAGRRGPRASDADRSPRGMALEFRREWRSATHHHDQHADLLRRDAPDVPRQDARVATRPGDRKQSRSARGIRGESSRQPGPGEVPRRPQPPASLCHQRLLRHSHVQVHRSSGQGHAGALALRSRGRREGVDGLGASIDAERLSRNGR